jgi:hypothetical protein
MASGAELSGQTGHAIGSRRDRWSDHRPQAAVIAIGLLFIVVVWSGLLFYIRERDRAAFEQAQHDAAGLAATLGEQVERNILGIDQIMRFALAAHEAEPDRFDLRAWVDQAPFLRSLSLQISMADAQGDVVASTLNTPAGPRPNIADRIHFRVHADEADLGLYVSRPVMGRVSQRWSIQLSRRLGGRSGTFAGVLVVSLDPEYLAGLFASADPSTSSVITLFGRDGHVRVRTPPREGNPGSAPVAVLDQVETCRAARLALDICRVPGASGEADQILALREFSELPLILSVGRSTDAINRQLR